MKSKRLWVFFAVFVLLFTGFIIKLKNLSNSREVTVFDANNDGKADYQISLLAPGSVTWAGPETQARGYRYEKENLLVYKARQKGWDIGTLTVTLRKIENRDMVYFIKYESLRPAPGIKAVITAVGGSTPITGHQIIYDRKIVNTTSKWSSFQVSPGGRFLPEHMLPKNAVFLDSPGHYLRLGLIDVYRPLKNHVRLEQYDKSQQVSVLKSKNNIDYIIPLPQELGCFTETWGVLSASPLVDWNNQKALGDIRTGDLVRYRKLSDDGFYYLTPANYYPTDKTAFWLNPGYHVAELFSKQKAGRYFRDIVISSMYSAAAAQGKSGYWVTYPRSDWLYHDYGISEGFYDTRFNTDAALFLLHMYGKFGDVKALAAAEKYAYWLRKYAKEQGIPTHGGLLVPDYYKPGVGHKKTHVSLNHLVTEMNFLYEIYIFNHDARNLKTAGLIRQAVRDTGPEWIRSDGNLHYAYIGVGKYGMQDYPLITLNDLRLSQKFIKQIDGSPRGDEVFQMLIDAKEAYLKKNNMPIK
ncbi:MAG: hypothetical protein ACYC21_13415 [Eubacteriales bacterium]